VKRPAWFPTASGVKAIHCSEVHSLFRDPFQNIHN
jgi:hypothetical protein